MDVEGKIGLSQSKYLFEFKIDIEQKASQYVLKVQYAGEAGILNKMVEIAKKEDLYLVYKQASALKKILFRQPYQFTIDDNRVKKGQLPHWNIEAILTGRNSISFEDESTANFASKSLIEELSAFAGKIASRQGKLFKTN